MRRSDEEGMAEFYDKNLIFRASSGGPPVGRAATERSTSSSPGLSRFRLRESDGIPVSAAEQAGSAAVGRQVLASIELQPNPENPSNSQKIRSALMRLATRF